MAFLCLYVRTHIAQSIYSTHCENHTVRSSGGAYINVYKNVTLRQSEIKENSKHTYIKEKQLICHAFRHISIYEFMLYNEHVQNNITYKLGINSRKPYIHTFYPHITYMFYPPCCVKFSQFHVLCTLAHTVPHVLVVSLYASYIHFHIDTYIHLKAH